MERATQDNKKELRIILDSNEVQNYFQIQSVEIKKEVVSDDEPTDNLQPISQVYLPEYQIKSEVDSTTLASVEQLGDKHQETKKLFSCSLCKNNNMSLASFKLHLINIHQLSNEEILKYVPEFYQCKYCHRQFETPFKLQKHEGSHNLPFKCDVCEKRFHLKTTLNTHKLTHSEPQFPCPHCSKKLTRRFHLKCHIKRVHSGVVHKCDQCEKKFKYRGHLLLHIRNHHSGITHQSSWKCDDCGKCFKMKHYLKRHIIVGHHTMSKNYLCSYCNVKFKSNDNLKLHIKASHNTGGSIESNNWSVNPRTYSKACNNVTAKGVSKPVGLLLNPQNQHIKEEISEDDVPETQLISEVYLPECQKGNTKTDLNSPLESTMTAVQLEDKHEDPQTIFSCSLCKKNNMSLKNFKLHLIKTHRLNKEEILKNVPEFYQCKYCHRRFENPSLLAKHEGTHTVPFKCDICYKSFSLKSILKRHKLTHSEPQLPCPHCDKKFRQKSHLTNHIESLHSGVVHKCDQCEKKFKYRSSLLSHIKFKHNKTNQVSWKCDECGKCFKMRSYLKRHIIGGCYTMIKNYLCSYCSVKFKSNDKLKLHIKSTHNRGVPIESNDSSIQPRTYSKACNNVNAKGPVDLLLKLQNQHIKEEILEDPEIQPISEVYLPEYQEGNIKTEVNSPLESTMTAVQLEDKHEDPQTIFSCSLCKKNNMSLKIFKLHLIIAHHLSNEEILKYVPQFYQCKYCQRQFKTPYKLQKHEGSHTLPFKCDICYRNFGLKSSLKSHKLTHSSERPFPCPHCDKKFRRKFHLKCHIESLHSGVVHKCDQCEKKFKRRSSLLSHIKFKHIKTNQVSWKCDECGKCFKIRSYLKRHIIGGCYTMIKNYLCSYCSVKFKSNDKLKLHIKSTHNGGVPIESNDSSIQPRTYSKACNNVNAKGPVGLLLKLQNQHIKEEISDDDGPEIQPISEVYSPEYQEGNIKTEVNSLLESTLTDDVEIETEITIDEMDLSAFKKEEDNTENGSVDVCVKTFDNKR